MGIRYVLLGAAAAIVGSHAASAAIPWSTPAGNLGSYTFDSGQSLDGKLSNAVARPDGFAFAPTNFVASANGSGSPATVADTASVVVHTVAPFWGVTVNLMGDYSILGTGSVDATGTIVITDLDSLAVYSLPLSMSNVPASTTSNANAGFSGTADLLSVITSPSNAKIELSATLTATANGNSTSLIQLKDAEITLRLAPEPTSLTAMAFACIPCRRRRRR